MALPTSFLNLNGRPALKVMSILRPEGGGVVYTGHFNVRLHSTKEGR